MSEELSEIGATKDDIYMFFRRYENKRNNVGKLY
jgi:hypothetical protein